MARAPADTVLVPSVFDRLLDDEPGVSYEPARNRGQSLRELEAAVARDLEALLNTRQETLDDLPKEYFETTRSLITYGLPDFTAFSLLSLEDRTRILHAVEDAIARFEPRLARVRVNLDMPGNEDRGLRFRLDELLRVVPAPESVTFDAVLQLNTQQYVVQGQY